jgi:hypothetical protein
MPVLELSRACVCLPSAVAAAGYGGGGFDGGYGGGRGGGGYGGGGEQQT